jgi:hypothetical protein
MRKTITETLEAIKKATGIQYACYGRTTEGKTPPVIFYMGDGDESAAYDNAITYSRNNYIIHYYFTTKNSKTEAAIEQTLIDCGYIYDKSSDVYISAEDVFVIYYTI